MNPATSGAAYVIISIIFSFIFTSRLARIRRKYMRAKLS